MVQAEIQSELSCFFHKSNTISLPTRPFSTIMENRLVYFPLMYARTKDGREVDFVVTERETLYILVGAKKDDKNIVPIA